MNELCPHCGAKLAHPADAFCAECRQPVEETPLSSRAIAPGRARRRAFSEEGEVAALREQIDWLEERVTDLEMRLRRSNLYSESFVTRAFTVWGHFLVAHLSLVIPILALMMFISLCAGGMNGAVNR